METKVISLPLYFAAPVYWYAEIADADILVLGDEFPFPGRTARNRINFCGKAGIQTISIPLQTESRKAGYMKTEISYRERWQGVLINALRTAYGKSPFFEYYDYRVETLIKKEYRFLWELNLDMLRLTIDCLKMNTDIRISDDLYMETGEPVKEIISMPYYQVFADLNGFTPGMSILDLLFNEGVDAGIILLNMKNKSQIIK